LGPGSYGGVRVGISLAQGWQLARQVELVGVSSSDAIALGLADEGVRGRVSVIVDAQRGEFYLGRYALAEGLVEVMLPLRLATRAEIETSAREGDVLAGPEVTRWFPEGRLAFPRAAVIARMAASRSDIVSGEFLEPIYLRETTFVKSPPPRPIPELAEPLP
jgi:tRNA threonylcarbamoyl adenosine modification protein YeaZ